MRGKPRPWPLIAAGILAALGLAAVGGFIIIKITNKDGTVTEVKVPDTSKIEIIPNPAPPQPVQKEPEVAWTPPKPIPIGESPFDKLDPKEIPKDERIDGQPAELVAVIGKRGRNIAKADAAAHVFGYCVGNDVTERMWQHAGPQWSLGKSFDTHAPIGPWIVTADEVGDPHTLGLRCFVNGEKRQDSNTQHLVFNIWQQVEHLSVGMTLEAGDCLFTGTPGGVGAAMDPRQFLQAGDVVRCEVDGLGHIEGTMIAEG